MGAHVELCLEDLHVARGRPPITSRRCSSCGRLRPNAKYLPRGRDGAAPLQEVVFHGLSEREETCTSAEGFYRETGEHGRISHRLGSARGSKLYIQGMRYLLLIRTARWTDWLPCDSLPWYVIGRCIACMWKLASFIYSDCYLLCFI
jgi:hypothetical protein